ncbi:MAG: DUF1730 domain-containing protein [Clostridium sp.]|nr:DUF1730 domain-containing protein [Prevotella sp.]MCM1429015.1 DUF1730 domain-containing protein [Clostridium sp.]MCM1475455.1 DUF1730 domain-containing protein [Muribaculaceae bacterium]
MKLRPEISSILRDAGVIASAVIAASEVDIVSFRRYEDWLNRGDDAGMSYMANHMELRRNPQNLFPGVASIICCAFSFAQRQKRNPDLGIIASYALGDDYHEALRGRLAVALPKIEGLLGSSPEPPPGLSELDSQPFRISIDSAPVMERYWAIKSGLGRLCANGMVEVEGYGTQAFLAEVFTRYPLDVLCDNNTGPHGGDDTAAGVSSECLSCGACLRACPGGALCLKNGVPSLNARKCISYLTIEHRGKWDAEATTVMSTPIGRNTIFGCDVCLRVCPKNIDIPPTNISELELRPVLQDLSISDIAKMEQADFSRIFKGSAIKRAKLSGLKRNVSKCRHDKR